METTKNIIALFPGQGSQKVGMGSDLFKNSEVAKRFFSHADEALGFSLSKICFEGPADKLMQTEITQPAILTVSTICFEVFKDKAAAEGKKLNISAAAGHSLGEYSALVASGAISFEDAVVLVNKRGRYMQEAVPQGEGKMVAVIGVEASEIEATISKLSNGIAQIANLNAPGQIVVAGQKAAVEQLMELMPDARIIELQVSAPFHCPLMKPAEEKLAEDLAKLNIKQAAFPVYSNFYAKGLTQPEEIREALRLQVCGRVRWIECMENAVSEKHPEVAVEFGSGNILTGMLKRINPALARANVDSIEGAEKVLKA